MLFLPINLITAKL
uniref:Uncharacterized protein n=1 Tax=Anguilla anguilla TaxID=7936 RepID=A0A0E9VE42_ANGAN